MEDIKIIFKFIKNIVWGLVLEGILTMLMGVLIFIYPNLLGMLVGLLLIITGIVCIILAIKVNTYSKVKIEM